MLVYLAGSIDAANGQRDFFEAATNRVAALGHVSFDPSAAFNGRCSQQQSINLAALNAADCVLAELYKECEHIGSLFEVGYALGRDKSVSLVVSKDRVETHSALQWPGLTLLERVDDFNVIAQQCDSVKFMVTDDMPETKHAYDGDAGFDLSVKIDTTIEPGALVDVPLVGRLAPPSGFWWRLEGRSSTLRKHGLLVVSGIMDGGYRGPCFAACYNLRSDPVTVKAGMRIAQAIPHKAHKVELVKVSSLPESSRGENGFGSSGV